VKDSSPQPPGAGGESREGPASTKRKIIHTVQIILGLALIAAVLSYVQIRDTATIPEGVPGNGTHEGRIERLEGRSLFESGDGRLTLEITREGEEPVAAKLTLVQGDGEQRITLNIEIEEKHLDGLQLKEGLLTSLRRTDPVLYVEALVIYILAYACGIVRWKLLLDAAGLPTPLGRATRYTCIGLFFNNLVPGLTGGDLVKAFYIARENRERKTDAVITVIIDRVMGITVLAAFSAVAVLSDLERYWEIAVAVYALLAAVLAAGVVFYSGRLRRLFRLDKIIGFLPFEDLVRKVDRSAFLYRYRKGTIAACILLTVGVHGCVILSLWTLGRGLSIECSLVTYSILVPIVLIVSALPITPAGWGVGEMSFVYAFGFAGIPAVLALALSFIHRFNTLLISLTGGPFLLLGRRSPHVRPADDAAGVSDQEAGESEARQ
jgi:uncharacterized protein (TIRG00374 family)